MDRFILASKEQALQALTLQNPQAQLSLPLPLGSVTMAQAKAILLCRWRNSYYPLDAPPMPFSILILTLFTTKCRSSISPHFSNGWFDHLLVRDTADKS
jgi:hypothetical protein